ncbi:MAG: MotA/TolQ/ExbB proton channel family protein [Bacteroidales bacterium]|nr:MotA/TolQ/ExbB proton channel family protein [Bacteroidales bacterium]
MFKLFNMGGPLFMGILTLIFFVILAIAVFNLFLIIRDDFKDIAETRKKLAYIKSLGLFAFISGILGQLIGLFSAFTAIEKAMDISPAILAGGLKVSMITVIYGTVIFLLSYLFWFLLDYLAGRKTA